jgi:hypothetical protein
MTLENKKKSLSLIESLSPVFILIILLAYNVSIYGDDAMSGSNQFILLLGAAIACVLGLNKGILFTSMIDAVSKNLKSITGAILILLVIEWNNSIYDILRTTNSSSLFFFTIMFDNMRYNLRFNWK